MALSTRGITSTLSVSHYRAILLTATVIGVAACRGDSVTGMFDTPVRIVPRRIEYRCIRAEAPGIPGDTTTTSDDGLCLPGYDTWPWG